MIDATIVLAVMIRTQRAASPTKRRMIARGKRDHFKEKSNKAMHNDQSSL
jgi:hypothetical protein